MPLTAHLALRLWYTIICFAGSEVVTIISLFENVLSLWNYENFAGRFSCTLYGYSSRGAEQKNGGNLCRETAGCLNFSFLSYISFAFLLPGCVLCPFCSISLCYGVVF